MILGWEMKEPTHKKISTHVLYFWLYRAKMIETMDHEMKKNKKKRKDRQFSFLVCVTSSSTIDCYIDATNASIYTGYKTIFLKNTNFHLNTLYFTLLKINSKIYSWIKEYRWVDEVNKLTIFHVKAKHTTWVVDIRYY